MILTIEDLLNALGDRFRELTWHKSRQEWTATGIKREDKDKPRKEWKSKQILRGGKTPNEALEKLLTYLLENNEHHNNKRMV